MPDFQIPCSRPIHQEHKPVAVARLSWPDARCPPELVGFMRTALAAMANGDR